MKKMTLLIIILAAACILMAFLNVSAYRGITKRRLSSDYTLSVPSSPRFVTDHYDSECGIYSLPDESKKEARAYARYINAAFFYYAYEDTGDIDRAAKYQKIMEETSRLFPTSYRDHIKPSP